jgi:hypothetical protein
MELSQESPAEMRELPELFGVNLFFLEHNQFCEHPGYQNARKNIPYLHDQIHPPWHDDTIACYYTKATKV